MNNSIVRKYIESYKPESKKDFYTKKQFISFIENNPDCLSRENLPGHITCSSWIYNLEEDRFLLTHHRKLNKWLQLGGHADKCFDPLEVAINEAVEESGIYQICVLDRNPVHLDIHKIADNHYHYDIRFCFKVYKDNFIASDESFNLTWTTLEKIESFQVDYSTLNLMKRCEKYSKYSS